MRWRLAVREWVALIACAGAAACFSAYGRVQELRNDTVSPTRFKSLVVVAGEDEAGDRQIATRVGEQLSENGLTVVRRGGLWDNELSALAEICPLGQSSAGVDGVVFVWWNRIALRDCETHKTAYQVQAGYRGVDVMVRHLLGYLRRPSRG
jgi:hypothetical protein